MSEARNDMVACTEVDKLLVAELAFTGSVNDQRGYLKTMRDLNRFFGKNKRLSNLTTISTNDYDQLPTGVKIIAVDILRDAFLSEPAHSFTLAESNDTDPRAILEEIGQFYNRTNASLGELEYRAGMAVVNDGTMLLHESPTGWIIRMREAHVKLNRLQKEAEDTNNDTNPWNNSTEVYKSLIRRRPTEQDTLELMTRGRGIDEVRGHGANAEDPMWFPWPEWFTYEVKAALTKIVKASSTAEDIAAQPTMNNFLRTFLTWHKDNSHLCPAAAPDSVRRNTEPGKPQPRSGTDKKRTDGGTARCIHESDHECKHTHKFGQYAGQCKFIIKSDGTPSEGCKSAARWKKTNGSGGNGGGGGGNGGAATTANAKPTRPAAPAATPNAPRKCRSTAKRWCTPTARPGRRTLHATRSAHWPRSMGATTRQPRPLLDTPARPSPRQSESSRFRTKSRRRSPRTLPTGSARK